ncbi:MAG: HEAT repeat domain-containing protein [Gemmatimonadota bacterium]|nr:HEAT repeat domain-containing protein [Gemmatimonadota bacterium]
MTKTLAILALALPCALAAQSSLASRIAAAPDGEVRMTYATRPKACGDGKDVVAVGQALNIYSSMESYGRWSGVQCVHGPARVALTVRGHEVTAVRARVGGVWKADPGVSLDLGVVPARDAAGYLIALAPTLDGSRRNNPLLAAAIADSAVIVPDLLRLARATSLPRETRRRAVNWVGVVGDASAVAPLTELAREGTASRTDADDPGPGDGVEGAAVGALAMLEDGVGMSALMDMARRGSPSVRKAAVFWLGQSDDARGRALVRTVVDDANETEAVRGAAIFALGQGDNATSADLAFLRGAFGRLPSDRLKDRVLMAMSQNDSEDGARWLLAQARDERQPIEVRRKAVFWAGQGHARLSDIVSLYKDASEPRLREHIIFVLSQRSEEGATDALRAIARDDRDREMRKKALFWLAQKNDPRVTKLIADLVTR